MNCLEFRRRCLAEPRYKGKEFLSHMSKCEACRRFLAQTKDLDSRLANALRIDVPESLTARVKLKQHTQREKRKHQRMFALVASVLLLLGIAGGVLYTTSAPSISLHSAVVDHIEREWQQLVKQKSANGQAVATTLATIGAGVKPGSGNIRYASLCDFSEYGSAHVVVSGEQGPALVLLLKGKHVTQPRFLSGRENARSKTDGILVPTSNGSMAIVGTRGEGLYGIEVVIRNSIYWLL